MDYTELTEVSVVFFPSVSAQIVVLTTFTDPVAEGDEIFSVTITTTQAGVDITAPQANVTIVDSFGMFYIPTIYFTIVKVVGIPIQVHNNVEQCIKTVPKTNFHMYRHFWHIGAILA